MRQRSEEMCFLLLDGGSFGEAGKDKEAVGGGDKGHV